MALAYWPYCEQCREPFQFDKDEPFAHCSCGTTEWGNPRPAEWVPDPRDAGRYQELRDRFDRAKSSASRLVLDGLGFVHVGETQPLDSIIDTAMRARKCRKGAT